MASTSEEGDYHGAIGDPPYTEENDGNDTREIPVHAAELADIIGTLTHHINSLNDHTKYLDDHVRSLDDHVKYLDDHVKSLRDDLNTLNESVKNWWKEVKTSKRRSIWSGFLTRRKKADETENKTSNDDVGPKGYLCTCCWPLLRLVSLLYKRTMTALNPI